ncbi:MAG: alpha/beta hydrolase [Porticoccaceae bacterium]|nr:alpha/beta hydrolase [Porticoccaceae bacterium]
MIGILVAGGVFLALLLFYYLWPDPLAKHDLPKGKLFPASADSDASLKAIRTKISAVHSENIGLSLKQRMLAIRKNMDSFFADVPIVSAITPVNAGGVDAEWVIAPGADSNRRLLYIHGGAFYVGSAKSHRVITSKLSEISNCAVLAINYHLMPEHSRMAGIEDCRCAYRWLLDNGPQGRAKAAAVFVAGDSAGGNLTLSLLAWLRDTGCRLPNGAVALSPVTDARMRSPSIKRNLETDIILKPLAKGLSKIPRPLIVVSKWLFTGQSPKDPVVSPLHGDLSGLPPILVQVSDSEILLDDGRRYVNKAAAAGTDAVLQRWQNVPHVWQIFYPDLPEAIEAFDEIEAFLKRCS